MSLLAQIAEQVRNESEFKDIAVADPVVLGVDKIEGRAVTYPVQIRVHTNKRDVILRELRRRIILDFEKNGIPLGNDPANMLILRAPNPTAPPAQQPLIGS
jgi:small conductance mechanosensitive channel